MYKLNPLELQKEAWDDVIELYTDVRKMQVREAEKKEKDAWKENLRKQGYEVRRATDDSGWW